MRINIVTGFFLPVPPVLGGATEKIWFELARRFVEAGHEVTFVSRQWPAFPNEEVRDGVHHVRLPGREHTRSLIRNLWHDFNWGRRVGCALPPADATLCNTVFLPVWLRRRHPRAGRVVPVVARMPKGQARFYGNVDLVLSLSQAVTEALLRGNPKLAGRIMPFPFPINWKLHADASAAQPKPADARMPVTIGYVGRVHPEKGIDLLLAAALVLAETPGIPPWRVQIIGPTAVAAGGGGDGYVESLRRRFRALGNRLNISGPEFDPAPLARRYAAMDVFCYPSLAETGETFGVAVAEAMAAQAVPVVSSLACFEELVTPEQTGMVFDHRMLDAAGRLAAVLKRLLNEPALRRSIAIRAQNHVQRFDHAVVADLVTRYISHLIALPPTERFDAAKFAVESSAVSPRF